ncbi:TIGR01906 family membrane protein [Limosilactobacillus caviae]|uniref:TIGR01906 family membrane protein n=1 Tax=Limosilactobacillus caviae TaxID=1769424 RepID=UPI00129B377C|nr:TIGR01906 family membrane protein [Limosilactobacillus caviae]MCD7124533.1 TIGR01906 family membrane protein [Limosilactobacillus caviae]MRH46531.1 TIGR01906 family membrane protein [Limosilactobacillus reuteri]
MNGKYELVQWTRAILLILLSLITAVSIALFIVVNISPLFLTFPHNSMGVSPHKLRLDYLRVIKYLQLPWINTLKLNYLPIARSATHHFADVKQLIVANEVIIIGAVPLLIYGLKKQKRQNQLWRLLLPFQVLFILLVFSGFMGITNFDAYFIKFHHLFFNNMDWVFNPRTSPIILLMPESFFTLLFSLWLLITLSILLIIWGWIKWELRIFFSKT